MSSRILRAAAVVALILGAGFALSYVVVLGMARPQPVIFASPNPATDRQSPSAPGVVAARQITAIGRGQVKVSPDTALVQIGVQSEGENAKAALNDNNAKMATLLAKLKELGVAESDIQTSGLSVGPRFDKMGGGPMPGYQVNNMVTVTIRNVGQTGPVLDQVLDAGANNLSGISFSIAEPAALEREARDKAIADARSRAEAMAKASGLTVGEVLSISENLGVPGGPYLDGAAAAGGMPIQPGQQTVNAQVQVTFELK